MSKISLANFRISTLRTRLILHRADNDKGVNQKTKTRTKKKTWKVYSRKPKNKGADIDESVREDHE